MSEEIDGATIGKWIDNLQAENDAFVAMSAQLYQAAGAYGLPENVLDNLLDMANGEIPRHKNILPIYPPDKKTDALVARVARLWAALDSANRHAVNGFYDSVLDETESESLAHIQAAAVEDFAEWSGRVKNIHCKQSAKEYLSQQGKDHD